MNRKIEIAAALARLEAAKAAHAAACAARGSHRRTRESWAYGLEHYECCDVCGWVARRRSLSCAERPPKARAARAAWREVVAAKAAYRAAILPSPAPYAACDYHPLGWESECGPCNPRA